jgi:patatin-like phospholipase/acyl hydrolase
MKKLLNIDGGGVRVYFSLLILQYIEKKTGKQVVDLFDFYSGVSASSIVLGCLLTSHTVDELIDVFETISKKMFYRSWCDILTSFNGLFYSKYSSYYIENEFKKIFQDTRLSQVKKPLSILAYDLISHTPVLFESWNNTISSVKLWKAIRGSTAAPTFFPPLVYDKHMLIDGGIVSNNLSDLARENAKKMYGYKEQILQVSIGTGRYLPKVTYAPSGLWSWTGLFGVLFSAQSNYRMHRLLTKPKVLNQPGFYRFDIVLDQDISLDNYNAFDNMTNIFTKWLECNKTQLDELCWELVCD